MQLMTLRGPDYRYYYLAPAHWYTARLEPGFEITYSMILKGSNFDSV
jgi:hypothetical protein